MAWKTMDVQEQRVRFVVEASQHTRSFKALCPRCYHDVQSVFRASFQQDAQRRAGAMMHALSQNLMKKNQSAKDQFLAFLAGRKFGTILADPPWQFQNRTGKVAPEHKRLSRYGTMTLDGIKAVPVPSAAAEMCHLYLWVPKSVESSQVAPE